MTRPVLFVQLGGPPEAVCREHGEFHTWYERVWGGELAVHDGRAGGKAPDARGYAGILVSGSSRSLVRPEPWMDDAAALLVDAHDVGTPVLGVCFGHQLLGYAFGAQVVLNPAGWEIGTSVVAANEEGRRDPLFAGLPERLRVNLVHQDIVEATTLPGMARTLASNEASAVQALAVGEHLRGVQFHPELTRAITRGYVDARRDLLNGIDVERVMNQVEDCPDGVAVMRNFRERFVEKA